MKLHAPLIEHVSVFTAGTTLWQHNLMLCVILTQNKSSINANNYHW